MITFVIVSPRSSEIKEALIQYFGIRSVVDLTECPEVLQVKECSSEDVPEITRICEKIDVEAKVLAIEGNAPIVSNYVTFLKYEQN